MITKINILVQVCCLGISGLFLNVLLRRSNTETKIHYIMLNTLALLTIYSILDIISLGV